MNLSLGKGIVYEIHGCCAEVWTVYSSDGQRVRAVQKAQELLATGKVDAVKVIRDGGARFKNNLVYEARGKDKVEKAVSISPVDSAAPCKKLEDYYGFAARKTIARLLRKYLDINGITALELLHNHGHLQWLSRNDNLINQAIQHITRHQVKNTDIRNIDRVDELYAILKRGIKRALKADKYDKYYDLLKTRGINELIKAVSDKIPEKDQAFCIRATIAAYIGEEGDWDGKLLLMIELGENSPDKQALAYIDEVIAEIFDGASAVQEVLGYQRNLGESLQTMAHLSHGSYKFKKGGGNCLERLNGLRKRFVMPVTRSVMLERVEREVGGVNPLASDGSTTEERAFRTLMGHMVETEAVFVGGGSMGEAVTLRAKTVLSGNTADESTNKAIDDLLGMLQTKANKFGYLVDLCGTDFGLKNQSFIISRLAGVVNSMKSIKDMVRSDAARTEIIQVAAGIRDRLLRVNLPDEWRLKFARKIYNMLLEYVDEAKGAADAKTAAKPTAKPIVKAEELPARREADNPQANIDLGKKTFNVGEYIFREGEVGIEAYLLECGEVEISRKSGKYDVPIARVGSGSIIGEMAIIDSVPRMASARVLKKTTLQVIPMAELQARLHRLQKFDPVMRRIVGMLVERMRTSPISDT